MNQPTTPANIAAQPPAPSDTGGRWVVLLTGIFVIAVTVGAQAGGWFVEQVFIISGFTWPWWVWAVISLGVLVLLLIPLAPLARFWPNPRYRTVFQTWAISTMVILFLTPLRFYPLPAAQRHVIPQIMLLLVCLVGVGVLLWLRERKQGLRHTFFARPARQVILIAGLPAAILAYPWLVLGALGSPLESGLNLIAGLLFGLTASLLLHGFLLIPLQRTAPPDQSNARLGGFAVGVALLIMSSNLGLNGLQLLLMLTLPATGWLITGLDRLHRRQTGAPHWLPSALLLGLTAAMPMLFTDPDELVLILSFGTRELLSWLTLAALITVLLGWSLSLPLNRNSQFRSPHPPRYLLALTPGLWLIGLVIYTTAGQPGFYGDHLFVILKEQADLSDAATIPDIDQRRRVVYETLVVQAESTQADLRTMLDQRDIPYRAYYLVNALDVTGGPLLQRQLARHPAVDRVLHNPVLRPLPAALPITFGAAEQPTEPQWNLTNIGADRVWEEFGVLGEGVVIGHSDSGVAWDHPELAPTYRGGANAHDYHWLDPWYGRPDPIDFGGHGTHTLGSIVGQTTGVAPGATWFGCANLPRNLGNPALYLDCMQFMLAPYPHGGDPFRDGDPAQSADILNNSWGCPTLEGCDPESLLAGAQALRAAGILVVVSAGNEGPACNSVSDPLAIYDAVFSVGAVDDEGALALFSSRGPVTIDGSERVKPDIVAPGVEILSAYPNNSYEYADGTSMAGPHVAGVAALVWSANPALIGQIDQTEAILRETARPLPQDTTPTNLESPFPLDPNIVCGNDPANQIGSGLVDAYEAVKRARATR